MLLLAQILEMWPPPERFYLGSYRIGSQSLSVKFDFMPPPTYSNLFVFFSGVFSRHFQQCFCSASPPGADPAQSLVLSPKSPGSAGRTLPPPPRNKCSRWLLVQTTCQMFFQHNRVEKGAKGQWEVTKYRTYQNMGKFRQVSCDF